MVKDNYIAGSGFGAIKKVLADLGGDSDLKGAESIWLVILIDNGIIGIIAYIVFFTSVIRRFLKEKRRAITKATERKISIAIVTVICYIIFVTLTGEMNTFAFFMLYAGMFGKLIYLQIQREKEAAFYNQQQAINNQSITGNIAA
jgi:O-antigen ligase